MKRSSSWNGQDLILVRTSRINKPGGGLVGWNTSVVSREWAKIREKPQSERRPKSEFGTGRASRVEIKAGP